MKNEIDFSCSKHVPKERNQISYWRFLWGIIYYNPNSKRKLNNHKSYEGKQTQGNVAKGSGPVWDSFLPPTFTSNLAKLSSRSF